MSDRYQELIDKPPVRRRTHLGQKTANSFTSQNEGVNTQHVAEVFRPYHTSSSASGIANQKTKVNLKSELVSPGPESLSEKIKILGALTTQAQQLGEEQRVHTEKAQQLEEQIKQGEVKYGKMLQDSLEIQRALELKKKHIKEDKEERERQLSSVQSKTEDIRRVLENINAIPTDGYDGSLTSMSQSSTG